MDTNQSHKTHKSRAVGNKAAKKDTVKKQKKGIDLEPNRGSNFKAFTGPSAGSRKVVRRNNAAERRENVMTLPTRDRTMRTLVQEPPLLVAVVGPPRCGKSTLIKSMVKFYTQRSIGAINGSITVVAGRARRVTFVEVPNTLSAMCDMSKSCDLAIIMVDGAFGFELETFEFLSVAQTHGFPKVVGMITKLDMLRTNKALKKTKRMLRHRFWHEVSAGASVMCMSPMVRGMYRPSDVLKLHRTLVTIEPKTQQWRGTHSCVFVDRFEDLTAPEAVAADADTNRSIAFYGYVRGKPINGVGDKFHIPGLGDVTVAAISRQQDPCEAAESNATSSGSKLRTLGAKHKRCYAPYCNIGGVEFDEDGIFVSEDPDLVGGVERHGAGLELMRELRNQQDKCSSSSSNKNKRGLQVLGRDDDEDDGFEDIDDDDEGGDEQQQSRRRKVQFANEETLELAVPHVESGSDDSSSDEEDDHNAGIFGSKSKQRHVQSDASSFSKRKSNNNNNNDDDDDDDLHGYGDQDDGDDLVASFENEASTAANSGHLRPLRPTDRDTSRVSVLSGIDWLGEQRLSLKRLFVTGQSLPGAAADDDDGDGEGKDSDDEAEDDEGEAVGSDAGYESVDSDEMNDPSLFTAAAAGGGDDDDDDDNEDEFGSLDDGGDDDKKNKNKRKEELSDDLQQYVDFFAARSDGGGNNNNNNNNNKSQDGAKTALRTGAGIGGNNKSAAAAAASMISLDETEALAGPRAARGGGGGGAKKSSSSGNGNGRRNEDDDVRMLSRSALGGLGLDDRSILDEIDDDDDMQKDDDDDAVATGQQRLDEDYIKKKMVKKKLFDDSYDAGAGKNNTTGFYNHLLEEERERRKNIETALEDVGQDIDKRVQIVGYFSGLYVRFVAHGVPVEFVRNFDPRVPIIAGGINPGEDRLEVVHTRFLRHRWYPRILKAQDPITISVGWRRIQVQPLYATEDGNGRWRYLKYTPKHMHCLAAFYGPVVPPNTGFIVIPTVEQKSANFRCLASGYTVGVDASAHIVKKLKITGVPESIHKTTCFIKGMFNSDIEAAKFVGAKVKTVSGLRGTIKKVMKGKAGIVRCTFEDRLLKSDICFIRTWKPVDVPRYCEVVPTLLYGSGITSGDGKQQQQHQQQQWRGMRTMAQLRREEGIELPHRPDSEYMQFDPRREGKNLENDLFGKAIGDIATAAPSHFVSRNTRMKLPFNMREEFVPLKTRTQLQELVRAETVIAPEPKELQRHALLNMFRDKADSMNEKRLATKSDKKKQKERESAVEEKHYKEKLKRAKKETARKVEFKSQHKSRAAGGKKKPQK